MAENQEEIQSKKRKSRKVVKGSKRVKETESDKVSATGILKSHSIIKEVDESVASKATRLECEVENQNRVTETESDKVTATGSLLSTSLESKVENTSEKSILHPKLKEIEKLQIAVESVKEEEVREKIIVIDGIETPELYKNSTNILKEFNNYCPGIKATAAFSLARGGVTIYLKSASERDKALEQLSVESFGGGFKRILAPKKSYSLFLRRVDTSIQEETLLNTIKGISSEVYTIKRLKNRSTGKPRQLVKLTCSETAAKEIITSEVFVKGIKILIEKQRNFQIIRCYSCQAYGHIAKNCRRKVACETCAQESCETPCKNPPKCANCNNNHPAFSIHCPIYIQKYEDLSK